MFKGLGNTFGNALGNAAIAGIEQENARNATKPAQAAIEIDPGKPQVVVQDLNMPLAPVPLVNPDQIVGSSDANSVITSSDAQSGTGSTVYMINGREVRGTVQVEPLDQVSMDGDPLYAARKTYRESYIANALAENQGTATSGGTGMDPVTAQWVSDYQAEKAQLAFYDTLDRENSAVVSGLALIGPTSGALGFAASVSTPVMLGLSAYGVGSGVQDFRNGDYLWGTINTVSGLLGAASAAPSVLRGLADVFDGLNAAPFGSPAAQAGKIDLGGNVPSTTAVDATAEVGAGNSAIPPKLYHYTNEAGMKGILESETLNPSLKALNPNDVRYGNGQYLSDISPGTMTPAQLSRAFINNPFQGARYTNFIEIDTTGLNVIQGRPGVYVVPNEVPLDLSGRITNSGQVLGQ